MRSLSRTILKERFYFIMVTVFESFFNLFIAFVRSISFSWIGLLCGFLILIGALFLMVYRMMRGSY